MQRLFWPLLTTIIFFSIMALWFCLSSITAQLTNQVENLLLEKNWATYDLKGRNLIIRGISPDENIETNILTHARAISGISSVKNEIVVTPFKKPFQFILEKNANTIIIKGDFPVEINRFAFLDTIDGIVIDQAKNARGASNHFSDWLDYALQQIKQLQSGTILFEDNLMSINGTATNPVAKKNITSNTLPTELKIKNLTITVD